MTTYNTGNPIGSTDARDLYDNAQNLDNFVNGAAASYTDRLGVSRRSLAGIDSAADNVLNSIGYAVPVAYASGISLTLTSQTVEYNGAVYAPKSSALPFTTSSWGADSAKFRAVQVTDADLITYTPAGTGAVATTVQGKLRESVSVKDFGAVGDGSTDDTAAIQAAIDYAKSVVVASGERYSYVILDFPNTGSTTYKITNSLRIYSGITFEGNGSRLYVENATYPKITSSTTVPADNDVNGQVGGGAFCDHNFSNPTALPSDLFNVWVRDFVVENARWAICIVGRTVACKFHNIYAKSCNGGIFYYGAIQTGEVINLETSYSTNVGVIAGAACYTVNHPWKAFDTNFVASPIIENNGHSIGTAYSADLDTWFKNAILRPTSNAYRANTNFSTFEYTNADAVNISGRFAYFPSRTKNANYGIQLRGQVLVGSPRGLLYVSRANGGSVKASSAEGFAIDASVQALGAEVNYIEHHKPISYHHEYISTEPATSGAVYTSTIQVSAYQTYAGGSGTNLTAMGIVGKIDPKYFKISSAVDTKGTPYKTTPATASQRLYVDPDGGNMTSGGGNMYTSTSENAKLVSFVGDKLNITHFSTRLPLPGGSQNYVQIWNDGVNKDLDRQANFNGKLTVYAQDLLTGGIDMGEYLIQIPSRYSSTTLTVAGTAGETSITVASGAVYAHFHAGDSITIGGTDKYLIASTSGSVITLATPLRANYALSSAVVGVSLLVRTITAPTAGYFSVAAATYSINITNSRGVGSPVKLYMKVESFQDMNSYTQ